MRVEGEGEGEGEDINGKFQEGVEIVDPEVSHSNMEVSVLYFLRRKHNLF